MHYRVHKVQKVQKVQLQTCGSGVDDDDDCRWASGFFRSNNFRIAHHPVTTNTWYTYFAGSEGT